MPPDNPEAFLIGGPVMLHLSLWLFYHRTDVFATFVNRSLIVHIDGSTAVGVMDGVSSAVRAERLECGVLRVRDLNRPKRIRFALRAGQTAPICHNSDTNGAVDLCLRLASSGRLRFGKAKEGCRILHGHGFLLCL